MNRRTFLATGTATLLSGCHAPKATTSTESQRYVSTSGVDIRADDYNLLTVEYEDRPQWFSNPYNRPSETPGVDAVENWDVEIAEIRGNTGHHPLRTTR